jgi:antirestriction protein ArdC
MSKAKKDVYQQVTDRIIEGLQTKGLQWFKPWNAGQGMGAMMPINNTTGRAYKGLNQLFLCIEQTERGYEHNEWLTYKQAAKAGGNVLKGSKGTEIVFWNISYVDRTASPVKYYRKVTDAPASVRPLLEKVFSPRLWNVFNIAQCEGIEPRRKPMKPVEEAGEFSPIEQAEKVYGELYPEDKKPTLGHGGASAFYAPMRHHVQMPKPETFVTNDDYYKTLFHELVHSTGHEDILNRLNKVAAFGSEDYSKEELVAEIGAQFLVGLTGIEPKDDHANSQAYINNWVKQLKDKPKMALSAANKAMKAVDFIMGGEA